MTFQEARETRTLAKPGHAKARGDAMMKGRIFGPKGQVTSSRLYSDRKSGFFSPFESRGLCRKGKRAPFALMHLAAMGVIARAIPNRFSATAQTIYGTFALGIASAVMTFASGYLYSWFGMHAFWVMASLCAMALPLVGGITGTPVVQIPAPDPA